MTTASDPAADFTATSAGGSPVALKNNPGPELNGSATRARSVALP